MILRTKATFLQVEEKARMIMKCLTYMGIIISIITAILITKENAQ